MLLINDITGDITLPRKLQFNPQSLKCFIVCSFNNSVIVVSSMYIPTPPAEGVPVLEQTRSYYS